MVLIVKGRGPFTNDTEDHPLFLGGRPEDEAGAEVPRQLGAVCAGMGDPGIPVAVRLARFRPRGSCGAEVGDGQRLGADAGAA